MPQGFALRFSRSQASFQGLLLCDELLTFQVAEAWVEQAIWNRDAPLPQIVPDLLDTAKDALSLKL